MTKRNRKSTAPWKIASSQQTQRKHKHVTESTMLRIMVVLTMTFLVVAVFINLGMIGPL